MFAKLKSQMTSNSKLNLSSLKIPFYITSVNAGFPSPAEDYVERLIDLNQELIHNQLATFMVRVKGDSMIDAGIHEGDVLIIDNSLEATNGKVIIGALNGEFTVKRLKKEKEKITLLPENKNYKPVVITPTMDFKVWGVVTYVIHKT